VLLLEVEVDSELRRVGLSTLLVRAHVVEFEFADATAPALRIIFYALWWLVVEDAPQALHSLPQFLILVVQNAALKVYFLA